MGVAFAEFFAVTILGFGSPMEGGEQSFSGSVESPAGNSPRVILVDSAGGVELET